MAKLQGVKVYCDVNNSEFQTPSVITGNNKRPDIVVLKDKTCMILELTVGFETNILKNSKRKLENYKDLVQRLEEKYDVKYGSDRSNRKREQMFTKQLHQYGNAKG